MALADDMKASSDQLSYDDDQPKQSVSINNENDGCTSNSTMQPSLVAAAANMEHTPCRTNPSTSGSRHAGRRNAISKELTDKSDEYSRLTYLDSELAKQAMNMGFDDDIVNNVIYLRLLQTGESHTNLSDLVEAVLTYQVAMADVKVDADDDNHGCQLHPSSPGHDKESQDLDEVDSSSSALVRQGGSSWFLEQENRRLKSAKQCKICLESDIDTVFIPCGHLVCCNACSSLITKCIVCQQTVMEYTKVFMT